MRWHHRNQGQVADMGYMFSYMRQVIDSQQLRYGDEHQVCIR